jgi:lipoate-protein ligase A
MTRPSPLDHELLPQATLLSVEAAEEQAWNEQQLAAPVSAPVARLWRYPQPALVLGRSQHALLASLDAGSGTVVPRSAGGGAVLVGPWLLGASVVLPLHHRLLEVGSIADSYRWLADVFVGALADHGVASAAVPRERTRKPAADLAWACFAGTSAWEVAVDERKLVGFAQRRGRHGVLLVAGVLIGSVPWPRLCDAMRRPAAQAQELAATTVDAAQLLGRPLPAEALAASLQRRLAQALAA